MVSDDKASIRVGSAQERQTENPVALTWFDQYVNKHNISKDDQVPNSGCRLPPLVKPEDDYEKDLEGRGSGLRKRFEHVTTS